MACNCEGKTINIGMGCCEPVLAPIENYYTKYQIDKMIESATTSGCCITPEEVESAITSAITYVEAEIPTVPTSNTAFTNDAGYLTEHQSLSAYSTTDEVNEAIAEATSGKADSYTAGRGISISTANTISLDLPIYEGSGSTNVSICVENGTLQGGNKINGRYSAGIGWGLETNNANETAIGGFNVSHKSQQQIFGYSGATLFSVGNGGGVDSKRHNALEIKENGDVYIVDTSSSGTFYEKTMIKLQDVIANLQSQIDELRTHIQ